MSDSQEEELTDFDAIPEAVPLGAKPRWEREGAAKRKRSRTLVVLAILIGMPIATAVRTGMLVAGDKGSGATALFELKPRPMLTPDTTNFENPWTMGAIDIETEIRVIRRSTFPDF